MFNPKGSHLLDEQLVVSGLEMSIDLMTGLAIGNAGISLVKGIMGSSSASKQNSDARKAQRKQKRFNKKVARKTNEYNEKRDAAEQANYHAMRDYSHDTSIKNWKRGKELQDFAFAQQLRQFEKSNEIAAGQFGLNQEAAEQAFESQMASVEDMFLANQFQGESSLGALKDVYTDQNFNRKEQDIKLLGIRSTQNLRTASITNQIDSLMTAGSLQKQANLVEGLLAEGKASLGQAGGARIKTKQSSAAALQRGILGIERELTGKRTQAGIELAQLNAETSLAITGVGLNLEKIDSAIESAEGEAEYNGRIMSSNMKSFINQTERNINQLIQQKKYADINTFASMMLEPEFAGYDPKPEKPPEREFVKSMKAIPGFVPPAAQQSVWAPLIKGIGSAAGAIASIDFGGQTPTPTPNFGSNFASTGSYNSVSNPSSLF
jgi:hypothetical protein